MTQRHGSLRDHYLPLDHDAFRKADKAGRIIVIAPTRAACETIELAMGLDIETLLEREHGEEIRDLARRKLGFGIMAGTGTGKTLAVRSIAEQIVGKPLRVGVVNREREATPETPTWNVVIVTTGIARRWFQGELIYPHDTLVVDEIHQTSAELELCLALGKRVGCRFIWLSATVDASFYARYLNSSNVLETTTFDPAKAAKVAIRDKEPLQFLDETFIRRVKKERRGVAVFLPTRAEVEKVASQLGNEWSGLTTAFYHGGQPIRVIRPFLDGTVKKPFILTMTAAGQSALNVTGLDAVVIHDARYTNLIDRGRNVLARRYLGANEILQMAGRVHGRVENGEVDILTDRNISFAHLKPEPPEFQLGGDSERVALTAAAIGVDLTELDLPVPLDKVAYREAVHRLTERGIVDEGRLTQYGKDIEAMPVDRPWAELLLQADKSLVPFIAAMSNVDSLHRMTRDEFNLADLVVRDSDHLSVYNVYADAVNQHGYIGSVFGMPRYLFQETLDTWAEDRGVLVKAIEDAALGMASVYRTMELELPKKLPSATSQTLRSFRELLAEVMPFSLVIEEETADGDTVKVSRSSLCGKYSAVAGTIRYFADRFGNPRASVEGTAIPLSLIRHYAKREKPSVEYRAGRGFSGLMVVRSTSYFGFELEKERDPFGGAFPESLEVQSRAALVRALSAGITDHANQGQIRKSLDQLGEYWRRSGGTLEAADPTSTHDALEKQLADVLSYEEFRKTPLSLTVKEIVGKEERERLDDLPKSAQIFGDRVPLDYEIENKIGIVRIRLREGQARRLTDKELPEVDRPLRFTIVRGRRSAIRADSLQELQRILSDLPEDGQRSRHKREAKPYPKKGKDKHRRRRK